MIRINNRKVPAWIGSILFHTFLVLFLLYWFSPGPDRGAPGERNAVGSIVLQSGGGTRQQAEAAIHSQIAESDRVMDEWEPLTNADLSALPLPSNITPGRNQNVPTAGATSATGMTEMLQQGGLGRGIGNQLGEATVQVFGTGGKGTKFMYVFDHSASMENMPIRMAKAELIRSLDSLGDLHQFNILFYSSKGSYRLWQPGRRLPFATPTNKQNAILFIGSITAEGGTFHYDPLMEAINHRPDVIFFLTDGERQDDLTPLQLGNIERANSRIGQGAQINVIQFGSGGLTDSPSASLQQLAIQNRGEHVYVNVITDFR